MSASGRLPASPEHRGGAARAAALALATVALACAGVAAAVEFRTTTEAATILYDGPSIKSHKLFVVGRDYPFEVVVTVEGWVKVRDMNGAPLAWVERKALGDKRVVAVKVAVADVFTSADPNSKMLFRVEQNVLLDLLEQPSSGWVKVRHRDGQSGYINISQVWGV